MQRSDICKVLERAIKRMTSRIQTCENPKQIVKLFKTAKTLFEKEPSVLELEGDWTIIGDIHGNPEILLRIFTKIGYPDTHKFLFLGDYVDRGIHSIDVLIILFAMKALYPENIYLIRGNHECRSLNSIYGLKNECEIFYNNKVYNIANDCFDLLPLCAIMNDSVFCVHGGISQYIQSREDIFNLQKYDGEPRPNDIATDLLWSDPLADINQYDESERGAGHKFGIVAAHSFLEKTNLKLIVRSHETCNTGFDLPFGDDGQFLTIFSSPDYCDCGNSAGIVSFTQEAPIQAQIEFFASKRRSSKPFPLPSFILKEIETIPKPKSAFKLPPRIPSTDESEYSNPEISSPDISLGLTLCS